MYVPTRICLTKGVGKHKEKLTSFELALRNAQIAKYNIVNVSSIVPPSCQLVSLTEGLKYLAPGQIIYCVMSRNATNEPHRLIAASIGIAIPKDPTQYGYLSEHHSFGETEQKAGDYAEDLAAYMLATILGVEFEIGASYDEEKELWKISGQTVKTANITQSAIGDKDGLWTTVLTAAILIPPMKIPEIKPAEAKKEAQVPSLKAEEISEPKKEPVKV
ncbi:MAG TPA: arginine decarboxylase, pyruvoyl-dependent [bacterium]|nr:arginine decarboxylase, pyruvoyl-dependent [bacterium]